MSIDSNLPGIVSIGGMGGGGAALVSQLAGTGNSVLIGILTGLTLIFVSAFVLRKAHRNLAD